MTREQARKVAKVMIAYANGEKIEYTIKGCNKWTKIDSPSFNWDWEYRVKPKPKFNHKTLQPFDKVLVRDDSRSKWCCSLFSHINNELDYPNVCVNREPWKFCIPYNGETKHLIGTAEEAPEFYRYWED